MKEKLQKFLVEIQERYLDGFQENPRKIIIPAAVVLSVVVGSVLFFQPGSLIMKVPGVASFSERIWGQGEQGKKDGVFTSRSAEAKIRAEEAAIVAKLQAARRGIGRRHKLKTSFNPRTVDISQESASIPAASAAPELSAEEAYAKEMDAALLEKSQEKQASATESAFAKFNKNRGKGKSSLGAKNTTGKRKSGSLGSAGTRSLSGGGVTPSATGASGVNRTNVSSTFGGATSQSTGSGSSASSSGISGAGGVTSGADVASGGTSGGGTSGGSGGGYSGGGTSGGGGSSSGGSGSGGGESSGGEIDPSDDERFKRCKDAQNKYQPLIESENKKLTKYGTKRGECGRALKGDIGCHNCYAREKKYCKRWWDDDDYRHRNDRCREWGTCKECFWDRRLKSSTCPNNRTNSWWGRYWCPGNTRCDCATNRCKFNASNAKLKSLTAKLKAACRGD